MQFLEIVPRQPLVVTIDPKALAQRQTLLDVAEIIKSVTTAEENTACSGVGSAIQKLVQDAKEAGLALRRPINADADKIKSCADGFCNPLIESRDRLGRLAAAYRQQEERKAEAERQARAAEIARLQEAERKAAEDARVKAEKGDLVGSLMADIVATSIAAATDAALAAPPPEAAKTTGQSFQARTLGWECTDINALYAARQDLCNPPTPKAIAIKAVCCPENPIPGLKLWWESRVSFKSR